MVVILILITGLLLFWLSKGGQLFGGAGGNGGTSYDGTNITDKTINDIKAATDAVSIMSRYNPVSRAGLDAEHCLRMIAMGEATGDYSELLSSAWAGGYPDWLPKANIIADIKLAAKGALAHSVAYDAVAESIAKSTTELPISQAEIAASGGFLRAEGGIVYAQPCAGVWLKVGTTTKVGGGDSGATGTSELRQGNGAALAVGAAGGSASAYSAAMATWAGARW